LGGVSALIVCATIVKGQRVLLVRHSDLKKPDHGDWLLPAGSVESGESLEEALKREISEELSLRIKVVRKLVEIVDSYTKDRLANFLCRPLTSRMEISSELSEAEWFDAKAIKALENIHAGLKQFLVDGFRNGVFDE
jgi:8-oxo-dGTP pyrophosphatase MutT (NUDIX family)